MTALGRYETIKACFWRPWLRSFPPLGFRPSSGFCGVSCASDSRGASRSCVGWGLGFRDLGPRFDAVDQCVLKLGPLQMVGVFHPSQGRSLQISSDALLPGSGSNAADLARGA